MRGPGRYTVLTPPSPSRALEMTSEATEEGFICPYCLVAFPTSDKLQCHFIDFHSEKDVGDMVDTYEVVDFGNGDSVRQRFVPLR